MQFAKVNCYVYKSEKTYKTSTKFITWAGLHVSQTEDSGPEYVENISSRSLKKTSDQRKLRLLNVYFSIFAW